MINLFETNTNDIQFLLDNAGKEVLINDVSQKALITNPTISEYDEKYISTLQNVSRGDIVELEGNTYLTITESVSKRQGKYKALIRHCNYDIEYVTEEVCVDTGEVDWRGNPILECTPGSSVLIPAIVDNKSFSVDGNGAINLPNNQILITMQDNPTNYEKFVLNFEFTLMAKLWKVLNVDLTKKGLLILTCQTGV